MLNSMSEQEQDIQDMMKRHATTQQELMQLVNRYSANQKLFYEKLEELLKWQQKQIQRLQSLYGKQSDETKMTCEEMIEWCFAHRVTVDFEPGIGVMIYVPGYRSYVTKPTLEEAIQATKARLA